MGHQGGGQCTGRRISRRQLAAGASTAVIGASLHIRHETRAFQEVATPATPIPGTAPPIATPIASPVASPGATPIAGPYLEVSPPAVRFDERFDIAVTGVEPGQPVTITSRLGEYGPSWTATATYTAKALYGAADLGYVDPASMIPIDGTFGVADTMAFIWAAQAPGSPWYTFPRQGESETVTITAALGDVEIGNATIERLIPAGAEGAVEVDEEGLVGRFFHPAGESTQPAPAVIVIGGSEGGLSPYGDLTASVLASHGYAALNLAYWGTAGLPDVFENIPLEYFGAAIGWLQRHPAVDPERIAIHGTSRGGEGALLIGSYYPQIKAVVSNVGSGYVIQAPWSPDATPAWTWRGEPLSYLPWELAPSVDEIARAEIPVERINGPVLLTGGDADGLWPSSWWSQVALVRLRRHEHPWADQLLRYPGAGHAIGVPYQPVAPLLGGFSGLELGGDPHSNAIANANSWPAIVAMLDSRLKSPS